MNTDSLKALWKTVFGDTDAFIDSFFRIAYSPDRCRFIEENGEAICALYWFDCSYSGGKLAYIYAVATHPDHRGKGLCRQLMDRTHAVLKQQGYAAAMLRPADSGLRRMYETMGYRDATRVSEFTCTAGTALPLRKLGKEEYAALRRQYLPENAVLQEGAGLSFLAACCDLYAGSDFLLAGAAYDGRFHGTELLGNREAAPGILAALGHETGSFRCPGEDIPFGMFLPLVSHAEAPGYLGLAFD